MIICLSRFVIGSLPAVNNSSLQAWLGNDHLISHVNCHVLMDFSVLWLYQNRQL